jgi:AhpD family alkylhydroperoxidase
MEARMKNPAMVLSGVWQPIQALNEAIGQGGVPPATLELVHLRVSQVNGCSACVDAGARTAKKGGETDERLFAVAAWREAPYFTDAERAALALAEAATRLARWVGLGPGLPEAWTFTLRREPSGLGGQGRGRNGRSPATRLADRPDPVPDEIWDEAAAHYDERGLAALVLMIGVTNLFNRLNATTKQVAGAWG